MHLCYCPPVRSVALPHSSTGTKIYDIWQIEEQGGFYGKGLREFDGMLRDLGLQWRAHHVIGAPFKLPPGAKMPTDEKGEPIKLPPMKNLK